MISREVVSEKENYEWSRSMQQFNIAKDVYASEGLLGSDDQDIKAASVF